EMPVGIRKRSPHLHGVGALVDGDIDEIDLARRRIAAAIRQLEEDGGLSFRAPGLAVLLLPDGKDLALRHRKADIDRVLADDGGEWAAGRPDQVTDRNGGSSDAAGDRSKNGRIARVQRGLVQGGLRGQSGGGPARL